MKIDAEYKIPTIVVIDDVFVNLLMVETHLEYYQVNLITKTSALEIINELDSIRPDIILMDLLMPDLHGEDAARLIKQNEQYKHIPIIAISASADEIAKIDNKIFSDVLNKPYTKEELLNVLVKFITIREVVGIDEQRPQKKDIKLSLRQKSKTPIRRLLKSEESKPTENDLSNIQFNGPTILAIDDLEVNLMLLESYTNGHNINLITKTSILEAINDLPKIQPDLVLIDIMMPELNGHEAAKRIKENSNTQNIPIISFTVNSKELETALNDGTFSGTLSKPFTKTQLFELLYQFLPHTKS